MAPIRIQKNRGICMNCGIPIKNRKALRCMPCHRLFGKQGRTPIPMRLCSICGTLVGRRDAKLCKRCYCAKLRRDGPANKIRDPESVFWSFVEKQDLVTSPHVNTPCWLFMGPTTKWGYGSFSPGKRLGIGHHAHRYAYFLTHGPIPVGIDICHHCDNPPCVRDDHLFPGTNNDNRQDSIRKGRSASGDRNGSRKHPEKLPRGANHWISRLNESEVSEIRKLCEEGAIKQGDIAGSYGVSQSTVSNIWRRKIWKHVA